MSNTVKKAAIFDMDGVLVVNMKFHEEAFYEFGRRRGVEITPEFFNKNITGSTNEQIMPRIFGSHISTAEIKDMGDQKEQIYRELYLPHLQATPGLFDYLDYLQAEGIGMAIASNAPMENIRFVADALGLDRYFKHMLNATHVAQPKPAPDMFLKCAELLGAKPEHSAVFEDAPGGIRGTHAAGMRAVALLTSHSRAELIDAHLYINDFKDKALYDFWK